MNRNSKPSSVPHSLHGEYRVDSQTHLAARVSRVHASAVPFVIPSPDHRILQRCVVPLRGQTVEIREQSVNSKKELAIQFSMINFFRTFYTWFVFRNNPNRKRRTSTN